MIAVKNTRYGFLCENCLSNNNIKEISIHRDGRGTIVRLCAKCRDDLVKILLNENDVQNSDKGMEKD